jgi:hypothetical protein
VDPLRDLREGHLLGCQLDLFHLADAKGMWIGEREAAPVQALLVSDVVERRDVSSRCSSFATGKRPMNPVAPVTK